MSETISIAKSAIEALIIHLNELTGELQNFLGEKYISDFQTKSDMNQTFSQGLTRIKKPNKFKTNNKGKVYDDCKLQGHPSMQSNSYTAPLNTSFG